MIPQPVSVTAKEGRLTLDGPFSGPESIRELLKSYGLPESGTWSIVEGHGDEGYHLKADTALTVEGSELGLKWAVQTLRQLVSDGTIERTEIQDAPDYPWRGSLLDVARWALPLDFLYRYIDLLALHKLNRLHLHLTDDQGWRFEVKRYPKLTEVGGFRSESPVGHMLLEQGFDGTPHGGFYTQDELKALVRFGQERGVEIMPEIDLPGHTQAAIAAYPQLGSEEVKVSTKWGIHDIVVNSEPETLEFFKHVLDEVVEVFPFEFVHLGGDEVRGMPNEQLGWWIGQLQEHLAAKGRKTAVWDELLEANPPQGLLFFGWRDDTKAPEARQAGFEAVSCPQNYAYYDWAESDREDEPLAIAGYVPLEQVYEFEPGDVTGVQGQLWTEYLPRPELVEWRAFPRLSALAELGWRKQTLESFNERLPRHLELLDTMNVNYRPR
ncbi:beta-N-acetylhexosaminidase [Catelliglobosispora koreensis]|uniref:beta-N-acetylhexosaminidase n=1 Tax=Catelliglobosispora koreensis TaxID=129052 RepID=UPI00036E50E2|nr:beta-N-acetylhexosaminidase [Catelliglobosispora koreensis]